MKHWSNKLNKLRACSGAVAWAKTQESPTQAWKNCKRGDWMLWLLAIKCNTEKKHRKIVVAACNCARLSLRFVPMGEDRPRLAIEAAECWAMKPTHLAAWAAKAAWAAEAAGAAEHKKCADIVKQHFPKAPKL